MKNRLYCSPARRLPETNRAAALLLRMAACAESRHATSVAKGMTIVLLAIWMCLVPAAWAGPGFQPVSPDELKMSSEPLAPGAPAIILYRQVDRDDNSLTSHEDN